MPDDIPYPALAYENELVLWLLLVCAFLTLMLCFYGVVKVVAQRAFYKRLKRHVHGITDQR